MNEVYHLVIIVDVKKHSYMVTYIFNTMNQQWLVPVDNLFTFIPGISINIALFPQLDIRQYLFIAYMFSEMSFLVWTIYQMCQMKVVIYGVLLLFFIVDIFVIGHVLHLQPRYQRKISSC